MTSEGSGGQHRLIVAGHCHQGRTFALVRRQVSYDADALDGPERTEESPEGAVVDVRREVVDVEGTAGRGSGGQRKSRWGRRIGRRRSGRRIAAEENRGKS